jgi:hypothetical protein
MRRDCLDQCGWQTGLGARFANAKIWKVAATYTQPLTTATQYEQVAFNPVSSHVDTKDEDCFCAISHF